MAAVAACMLNAFRPSTKTEKRFARSLVTRLVETVKVRMILRLS